MTRTTDKKSHRAADAYRDAGVDTDQAEAGLQRLTRRIKSTWPMTGHAGEVKLDIGYFANVVRVGDLGIAICTDGIGSKALVAQMMHKYDTVGIDCVAMNVNDLICVGARPVSMVDYIAVQTANADLLDALSIGLADGASQAGVSISGGEISQLKDIIGGYREGYGFDLVGMAMGEVSLEKINNGRDIQPGDIVIGIESNGIHSNGVTLARRAFFENNRFSLDHQFEELDRPIGEELLRPTHIYVREILDVLNSVAGVKAMVHITSDGLLNLARVAAPVGFIIDAFPTPPPIFSLIQHFANVERAEMYHVYNMGIGFCLVVSPESVDSTLQVLSRHHRKAHLIGRAVNDPKKQVIVNGLIGSGKKFVSMH